MKDYTVLFGLCLACSVLHGEQVETRARLPLPERGVAAMPPLTPCVITAGGQRLLLSQSSVRVVYQEGTLRVSHPGWWVINYPLTQIQGLTQESADTISLRLFGKPAAAVRNWYVRTEGDAPAEPEKPKGPAPITVSEKPQWIVNTMHPLADDAGPGTSAAPFKTIMAALAHATPGTHIRVMPGVYREQVTIQTSGTREAPIRLEGLRDAEGHMPIISGNDLFPANAWQAVEAWPGVYRADIFTGYLGTLALNGQALIERSLPSELTEGDFCLNRASHAFLAMRFDGQLNPQEGKQQEGHQWTRVRADQDGMIDLGAVADEKGVVWASTYLWVEPSTNRKEVVWHPVFPEPITGELKTEGAFRAARMTGTSIQAQVNKYRVWVNGCLLPSVIHATENNDQAKLPHPYRNYGQSDQWSNFTLKEGWNHLVFQFDTTTQPKKRHFRFGLPKGVTQAISSATEPKDRAHASSGTACPYVSEVLLLGPFPSKPDVGVYVRLKDDADPNAQVLDLAKRGTLVEISADFVDVRGFEIRHGGQFQQKAQVALSGQGVLLEGCLVVASEVKGISFVCQKDQQAAPIIIRNNWVVGAGNTGIGGSGSTDELTVDNQDGLAPGRSPVVLEHNTIVGNNWAGFPPFWESGGIKVFKLTGSVIRYNTIIGGCGPGIWLDWEHYGNRLEGNLFLNGWGFAIGIEASPGPNLIANNVSVDLRPGPVWFREAILSWSSDRNRIICNTIDGRWSSLPAWQKKEGTGGIFPGEGGPDRRTRWIPLTQRRQVILNNLVVGCRRAVASKQEDWVDNNYTDKGQGASESDAPNCFLCAACADYRLIPGHRFNTNGVETIETRDVRHDFYGLLRFPGERGSVGAFRGTSEFMPQSGTCIEVEYQDGTMRRL